MLGSASAETRRIKTVEPRTSEVVTLAGLLNEAETTSATERTKERQVYSRPRLKEARSLETCTCFRALRLTSPRRLLLTSTKSANHQQPSPLDSTDITKVSSTTRP